MIHQGLAKVSLGNMHQSRLSLPFVLTKLSLSPYSASAIDSGTINPGFDVVALHILAPLGGEEEIHTLVLGDEPDGTGPDPQPKVENVNLIAL